MKLPTLKAKEVLKILQKAGFCIDHQSGSHITLLNTATNKRVIVPFHSKDIRKGTLHSIIKSSGLSLEKFLNLR
ncbi:MAG: type II toxin-antitoxin system HicA family toxin [Candidatus Margulisiibacteriota bacterium]|nr:type II toxin-antitoxin system HicA family toxin [Candidatus Margulisiibacteriota bacterium]